VNDPAGDVVLNVPLLEAETVEAKQETQNTSDNGLLGLLGGLDPKILGAILELLLGGSGGEQDHREELLNALRPYLSAERQGNVDRARSAYRMARTAQTALKLFDKS
jgi:hypothetical protein